MAKKNYSRCGEAHISRFLKVKKILEEESDQNRRFSVKQILERLGLPPTEANMRAIRSDIKQLRKSGVKIARVKHRTFEYYVETRRFSADELKLLADIVQSSCSLAEETSGKLIESILDLGSSDEAKVLKAGIKLVKRPKTQNANVFSHIGTIQEAILTKRKVLLHYFDIGYNLERVDRYDGEGRTETPLLLTYLNDCYYMISYNEKRERINARRLDRIESILCTGEPASQNEITRNFDLRELMCTQFGMFIGRKASWVTLKINDKKMMNPLYDHFGDLLRGNITPPADGKPGYAHVKVIPSPQFYGWLAGLDGGLEVIDEPKPEEQ